jgi:hypothetical protein
LVPGPDQNHKVLSWLWAAGELNWWIGTVFALGAFLFAAGCILSLTPSLAQWCKLDSAAVNAVFFAGSIPFTTAAYLQLFQASNAPPDHFAHAHAPLRRQFLGWRPRASAGGGDKHMQFARADCIPVLDGSAVVGLTGFPGGVGQGSRNRAYAETGGGVIPSWLQ